MIVHHPLAELFHGIASALLRCQATEFNLHQATHSCIHQEVSVMGTQIGHTGLFAGCTSGSRVAIAGSVCIASLVCIAGCVLVCSTGVAIAVAVTVLVGVLTLAHNSSLSRHC